MADWITHAVTPLDLDAATSARTRQASLTKPPGSLGQLETLVERLAAQQGRAKPALERIHVSIFAADHGVAAQGVSAFPQSVTAEMVRNFARGGAAISVLAHELGATLEVVNLGTLEPLEVLPQVFDARIAPGCGDISHEAAMDAEAFSAALDAGRRAVERALEDGADLFIGGEMGIGNTTAASALGAALLDLKASEMVGPGTGVTGAALLHKVAVVEQALACHTDADTPQEQLRRLGGFELAALAGAYLYAAQRGLPVLVDGFICSVAALAAVRINPGLADWLHLAHASAEPGHSAVRESLGLIPLLDLGLRLGEGSGAAIAVPLLRSACALHARMATFAEAEVSGG